MTLLGKLACPSGTSVADQPVTVYRGQPGTGISGASIVGIATTEPDGSYQLDPAAFDSNSIFFVRAQGARGAHAGVKVAPRISISGPPAVAQMSTVGGHASPAGRNRATFTGTVGPADAGAVVALQLEYVAPGENWRPVAFGHVDSAGNYSITHGFRTPGVANIRVVVHPTGPNVAAASEPLSYEISQAQNPRLTIDASADPISYGQSVTISGVAAAGANQPVTLLARTPGGAFLVVATGVTDTRGDYQFTQSPLQNTAYRVTDAAIKSTTLFEGVKYALSAGAPPSTVGVGQQLTLSGTLSPAHVGQVVELEREGASGVGFSVVGVGTVTADSTYSIAYAVHNIGNCIVRIKVPASLENQASTSEPFSIRVMPALAAGMEPEEVSGSIHAEG